ncbi:MAG: PEP-CTERM sorting domain-containing protein [Sedimentisphaerales bacterium]|nr:PEP-CTERM sorting domain-containing protein [Sedimentisphaerales bacterium]
MKKGIYNIIVVCLLCSVLNGLARGEIITIEVTGVVNSIDTQGGFALDDSVYIGSEMTGSCSYDTEAIDHYPQLNNIGEYDLSSVSMTIGNYTFFNNPMPPDELLFKVFSIDLSYIARSLSPRFDGFITLNGSFKSYDDIDWQDSGLTLINVCSSSNKYNLSDSLPVWLPDISEFDWYNKFSVAFTDSDWDTSWFGISGSLSSWTIIPEPAMILLLGLGSLALTRRKHR